MLDLIIKGGQVVTSWGVGDWEIAVQGDKIVGVGAPGTFTEEAGRVIDASGKIVVPGGIEPHAHIAAPFVAQGQNLSTGAGQPCRPLWRHHHAAGLRRPESRHRRQPGHRRAHFGLAGKFLRRLLSSPDAIGRD